MKYIFELILTTVIIFFLWNMLKRIFFTSFHNFTQQQQPKKPDVTAQKTKKGIDPKLNWDAETVEYEEIKEDKTKT